MFDYLLDLFKITNAPITPGTHPANVRISTIRIEPQPLSNTARGGKIMESRTLIKDMFPLFLNYLLTKI